MAKLLTSAQIQELKRVAEGNNKVKSALQLIESGRPQDLRPYQKKLLRQTLNMKPKDFASAVESRLAKPKSAADLPKPARKAPPQKTVNKPKGVTDTAKKVAKNTKDTAKKVAKTTADTAKKVAKTTVDTAKNVAPKLASNAGAAVKGAGKFASKAFVPAAAALEAYDAVKAIATDKGREEAQDYASEMGEKGVGSRILDSALSPSKTIVGAYSNLVDSLEGDIRERARAKELDATVDERKQKAVAGIEAKRRENAARLAAKAATAEDAEDEKPAIRKSDARFLDRLDERVLEDLRTEPVEESDYDPTKHDMYGSGLNDDYDPTKHDMYGSGPDDTPPKAVRVSPEELAENEKGLEQEAISMFKNTHGTEFDPKSKVDRKKLALMTSLLTEQGGLGKMTPNQFALKVYRNS